MITLGFIETLTILTTILSFNILQLWLWDKPESPKTNHHSDWIIIQSIIILLLLAVITGALFA